MIAIECGHSHSVAVSETSQMLVRIQAQLLCFLSMFSKSLLHSDSQRFTTTGNRGYHLTEINGCRCSSNPPAIFALLKIGMEAVNPLHPLWVSEAQGLDFRLPLEQRVLQLGYHGMQHSGLVVHSVPHIRTVLDLCGPIISGMFNIVPTNIISSPSFPTTWEWFVSLLIGVTYGVPLLNCASPLLPREFLFSRVGTSDIFCGRRRK